MPVGMTAVMLRERFCFLCQHYLVPTGGLTVDLSPRYFVCLLWCRCEIHTFDCTYDGKSQDEKRHVYHKVNPKLSRCCNMPPSCVRFQSLGFTS
jgi:hypothetical protein